MTNDVRVALRVFRRKPGFAAAVGGILALGIGVNITVFNLAWGLLYRPLPYANSERLVRVWGETRDGRTAQLGFSVPRYERFRDGQSVFSRVAVDVPISFALTGSGDPVQVNGRRVSAGFFDVLGVVPVAGRGFRPEEEDLGGVAVITVGFWKDRLAGAADVLGRAITIDGAPYEIVGVVPELPVADGGTTELYVTRPYDVGVPPEVLQRGVSFLRLTGRLREGVTLDQARAEMSVLAGTYRSDNADKADAEWATRVRTVREDISNTFRAAVITLVGAVTLVLLLACSNVANLLTGHFLGRQAELTIRTALGASRWHVLRQCVVETTVLSGAGAIAGLVLAVQVNRVLPRLGTGLPLAETPGVPWSLLVAAIVLALLVGVATGVYPGLRATKLRALDALRGSRANVGSRHRLHEALVAVQVAVSLVLLFAAALLTESFRRVSGQDPGFDATNVLTAAINVPPRRYPTGHAQNALYDRLREALENAPAISSAALIAGLPLSGALSRAPYARADRAVPLSERPLGATRSLTPGYFKTLGIPLRAGRDFTSHDDGDAPPVVILSESTARRLFPDEDPIGRVILTGSQRGGIPAEVVGIVGDVRSLTLNQTTEVELYRPFAQRPLPFAQIVVKAAAAPETIVGTLRAVVREVDPELPLVMVATAQQVVSDSLGQRRLVVALLAAFAALAFVLAAVGIYAVVAFMVGQRTAEIGLRVALGARPSGVVGLMARQGIWPVVVGALIGLATLPWVSNRVADQLFQVSPLELPVVSLVVAVLMATATAATLIPATRAGLVDPVRALRGD